MAEHEVTLRTPAHAIGNRDHTYTVKKDGEVRGRLKVSRGGVAWKARSAKKQYHHLTWSELARLIAEEGKNRTGL